MGFGWSELEGIGIIVSSNIECSSSTGYNINLLSSGWFDHEPYSKHGLMFDHDFDRR